MNRIEWISRVAAELKRLGSKIPQNRAVSLRALRDDKMMPVEDDHDPELIARKYWAEHDGQ